MTGIGLDEEKAQELLRKAQITTLQSSPAWEFIKNDLIKQVDKLNYQVKQINPARNKFDYTMKDLFCAQIAVYEDILKSPDRLLGDVEISSI